MGLMDKLKKNAGKAKDLAEKNADKIADGVDKATDAVDKKTKGKYRKHLDKVDGAASDLADKAKGRDTDTGADGGGDTGTP
jgi:hypothetical protein